jgi:hypothetical protein
MMRFQSFEKPKTIGVVIPAFNEAKNLETVLDAVCATSWFSQIIVVDDGSSDETHFIAVQAAFRDTRVLPIHLPENQGKAAAMLVGVRALQTDLVLFLDADLKGLIESHFLELCAPLQNNECEMTIAVFQHGGLLTDASHRMTPYLTGQRCLHRNIAEQVLTPLAGTRYGVEMGLTIYAREHSWRIQKVIWSGVTHRMKEQKRNGLPGIKSRWQMYSQILAVAIPVKRERGIRRSLKNTSRISKYLWS